MKGRGEARGLPVSSPTGGGGGVRLDHDHQTVAFKAFQENGHAMKNGSYGRRERGSPEVISRSREPVVREEAAFRGSTWMTDSSSQAYSGPEDNSTDAHESLTETSTLTLMENHSLRGVEMVYLKEFVLIDDDDDGDMSLREKTVTDFSVMDGKAAELVCGRLLSTSSCSLSEGKDEPPAAPPPEEEEEEEEEEITTWGRKRCCLCTLL